MADNTNILAGVGAIVNLQNVKSGVNVDELAKSLINDGLIQDAANIQSEEDPASKFNAELAHAAKKLGIEFDDVEKPKKDRTSYGTRISAAGTTAISTSSYFPDHNTEHDSVEEESSLESSEECVADSYRPESGGYTSSIVGGSNDFKSYTQEQIRRKHIENVIGGSTFKPANDTANSFLSQQREEETKADMLGEISLLLADLEEEGANLKGIREVSHDSSLSEVRSTLMALRYRSDSTRCASTAGDILMLVVKGVEKIFNGKREIMGYYPNMEGFPNTVAPKIRRLKPSMGRALHDAMEENRMGPMSRLAMEIFPSAIMYGISRSQQIGEPGLFRDGDI